MAPKNKDENQANILCDIYWEAPWDPNICRRKLLNVQKVREKQQVSRRGFNSRNVTPRPSSENSTKASESPRLFGQSPPKQAGLGLEQQYGLGAMMSHQGLSGQLSASYTDYGNAQSVRVGTDGDSVTSAQHAYIAPLSYSDAGYQSGFLQNSLNELDFAYALQRPGVMPMGDSVCSSVDLSAAGLSQQQHQHLIGAYGNTNRNHLRSAQQRHVSNPMTSRSYGEMGDSSLDRGNSLSFAPGSLGTAPGGLGQNMPLSGQMGNSIPQQSPSSQNYQSVSSLGHNLQYGNQSNYIGGPSADALNQQAMMMQSLEDPMMQAQLQQDPTSIANNLQQQMAQVYLQQQHAALQQQQFLLQQQQAALALQQQQLQAYGLSPVGQQMGAMNQFAQPNGGYFYVTSADGTPMMVSAAGLAQSGVYGIPQQPSGYEGTSFNSQHGSIDPRYYQQDPNQY